MSTAGKLTSACRVNQKLKAENKAEEVIKLTEAPGTIGTETGLKIGSDAEGWWMENVCLLPSTRAQQSLCTTNFPTVEAAGLVETFLIRLHTYEHQMP